MCISIDYKKHVTRKKLVIFKYVKKVGISKTRSPWPLTQRAVIRGCKDLGKEITYYQGEFVSSPSGPGIMGYKKREDCVAALENHGFVLEGFLRNDPDNEKSDRGPVEIIKLTIYKNERYSHGIDAYDYPMICAQRVYVPKE